MAIMSNRLQGQLGDQSAAVPVRPNATSKLGEYRALIDEWLIADPGTLAIVSLAEAGRADDLCLSYPERAGGTPARAVRQRSCV
jgi:hypothetical protein